MNQPTRFKAIFFDAGGTLFRPHPSVGEIYARVAGKYGMEVDPVSMEKAFREEFSRRDGLIAMSAHADEKNEKAWWKNLVKATFSKSVSLKRFEDFFDDLYDLFARAEAWRLYPDVRDVLTELKKKKLVLGIVSNWDSRLLSICEEMQLNPYFDFILASAVVGSAKPERGIFEEALKRAGVKPAEALHVGDSIENDYHGARNAGIHAVIVNRTGRMMENIHTIPSLEEILTYTV
jgi:putative hydrolase of the HAD superfamily